MRARRRRRVEAARRFGNDNHYLEYSEMLAREQPDVGRCARAVRINFENVFRLAQAGRTLGRAVAAGSIPPETRQLWNRMEAAGVEVQLSTVEARSEANRTRPIEYVSCACSKMPWTTTATRAW